MVNIKEWIYNHNPIWIQNIFCSYLGFQNEKLRYGKIFKNYYKLLINQEFYTIEQLEEYQEKELGKLFKHCYENVRYYKTLFDKLGLNYKNMSIKHLQLIPILNKATVKENVKDFIALNIKKEKLIARHTSGTTGSGMKFYINSEALQKEYATVWARSRQKSKRDESYLTFAGRNVVPLKQKQPPFFRKNFFGKQFLFSQYHLSDKNMPCYIDAINNIEFSYFQGYPSVINIIARFIYENNIKIYKKPRVIYTSSETLFENQRELIEKVFECKVFDFYGTTEMTSVFTQCEYNNYHTNFEYGITEFLPIERIGGLVRCEVVSTCFLNQAFPLVRYKTNDFVLIDVEKKVCKCGRAGPVIKRIEGRMEDVIKTPEGNVIGRLDHIFKDLINIKESQIIQESLEEITILIVKGKEYQEIDEKILIKEFSTRVSKLITLNIKYVDKIERTKSGKFRAVISKINQ